MKYCSSCGKQASDEARFCEACGHPFSESPGQPPATGDMGLMDSGAVLVETRASGDGASGVLGPKAWAAVVSGVFVILSFLFVMIALPLAKPILRPLVCPAGSKGMVVVSWSTTGSRGGTRTSNDFYCLDRNGAPRYVSDGKIMLAAFGLLVALAAVLFGVVYVGGKVFGRNKTMKPGIEMVIFLGLLASMTSCKAGTISQDELQNRFKGYLWTEGGQRAFLEDLKKEIGSKISQAEFLEFGGTRADVVLGPKKPGRYYYYDLGHLVKAGHTSMNNSSPCLMDLSELDPTLVPRAVARAREEAPGLTVQSVTVIGQSSSGTSRCDRWTFFVQGQGLDQRAWRRTYDQKDL